MKTYSVLSMTSAWLSLRQKEALELLVSKDTAESDRAATIVATSP